MFELSSAWNPVVSFILVTSKQDINQSYPTAASSLLLITDVMIFCHKLSKTTPAAYNILHSNNPSAEVTTYEYTEFVFICLCWNGPITPWCLSVKSFVHFFQHALRYRFETLYAYLVGGTTHWVWVSWQLGHSDLFASKSSWDPFIAFMGSWTKIHPSNLVYNFPVVLSTNVLCSLQKFYFQWWQRLDGTKPSSEPMLTHHQ